MSEMTNRMTELEAMAAAKDAIIAEQADRLAALAAEIELFKRLAGELAARVDRGSHISHLLPPGDEPVTR